MALEMCPACGEEHESPRGSKCKRTKLPRKSVKLEVLEMSGEISSGSAQEGACSAVGEGARAKRDVRKEPKSVRIVEDEEEKELRERLETRACERRKKALRAALENSSGDELVDSKTTRGRRAKKTGTKGRRDSPGGSDPESSSSSSDSTSSSSSRSRSRSGSKARRRRRRKKRSKFSLDKMTKGEKSVKRLTFIELLYAALMWGIKRSSRLNMDLPAMKGYMGHMAYMCMHATTGTYTDNAYRGYDKAVREKVKEKGIKCFKMGDQELSILHFNLDNSRALKEPKKAMKSESLVRKSGEDISRVRGACYGHNYNKDGCANKKCVYDHKCVICKNWDHTLDKCPNKRY